MPKHTDPLQPASTLAFVHAFPRQRLVQGAGAIDRVAAEALAEGMHRPFVVCSARGRRSPLFARAIAGFEGGSDAGRPVIWDDVPLHAPLSTTLEASALARREGCDGIVAFGGGSVSDMAKGVALALAEGDGIERFALRHEHGRIVGTPSTTPKVPLVAIPTTLSGAEVTPGFSLTREDAYKVLFRDQQLAARVLVFDPQVLDGMPHALLAGTLANALAHGCEALYSSARTPVSDLFAREGLARLVAGADAAFAENGVRAGTGADDLLLGSYLVAAAIINARTALHHATCHKLAPVLGASHGEVNALVLPHALAFNLPACPGVAADLARAIGATDASTAALVERLERYARAAGLRRTLREFGIARSALAEVARRIHAEPGLTFNPRPIESAAQIEAMLQQAW
ncbi:MAG: iron-containing alcohol dehydrogenase [Rhodocyclaceae bacterium]|nr:iron-containing alcohol dehydrogenase [Rhodocyclaceae bacterium]MCA3075614.1 iron-containing alcohol dehydrogenase [Rhodocyclaceae bacterium]MCA3089194.1 iron-containing alcohol dehydrogenase [Rhodocyclaceae bacterium]MCA3092755.1 iron-containing alcohol dehydrogenase [Rhodocyclaceae bacterium]MCA3097154.1 iron-containing alcohol dehydrogenase [Rhodocyclaceae bacterium]